MRRHRIVSGIVLAATVLLGARTSRADVADATCATAATLASPVPLTVTAQALEAARKRGKVLASGLDIVLVPGAGLVANPAALAAFERAAERWEAVFSDPIVVTIDADFADLGNPAIIGQAGSVLLQGPFDVIRDAMVADADADDEVVAAMPTAAEFSSSLPPGFSLSGNVMGTKASLKALGFTDLDVDFGVSDATITFNSTFAFDLDASDGVDPGTMDLETVAVHEIGHALGFLSSVDAIDGAVGGVVTPGTIDLYRFAQRGGNPTSASRFTRTARSAIPGHEEVFDDVASESAFSTGVNSGDGRQASHWKDDALTGAFVGVMDPTLAFATIEPITSADLRALDLIGYDRVPASVCGAAPDPAASCLLSSAPLASSVAIDDRTTDARDQLKWLWGKGAATSLADFLDPSNAETRYEVCVYDASGDAQPLRAAVVEGGGVCGSRPCWRPVGTTGFAWSRSASVGVGDGVTQVKLLSGPDGRAQVSVKAKGANLAPPDPALVLPVTVQLIAVNGASRRCWQSVFASSSRNDDQRFTARGP